MQATGPKPLLGLKERTIRLFNLKKILDRLLNRVTARQHVSKQFESGPLNNIFYAQEARQAVASNY